MKNDGFAVTVFDLTEQTLVNQTTRSMLKSSIPVFKKGTQDLDAFLKDFGIEIIHSHHTIVDLYFSRRTTQSIPHVVSTHGLYETLTPQFAQDIGPSIKHVDYWVYTADKNLQSMKIYPWFKNRPKTKIINGYEPDRRVSKTISRKQLNIPEDAFVVCLASRAIREKGWREAIDAVKIANTKSPRPIFLILIGDGPLANILQHQVDPSEVLLLGFKENIFDYFGFADIGLLPTTFVGESCPMVLIECISMHTPFISTNVGEIKSMLTLDNGQVAGEVLDLHDGIIDVYQLADTMIKFANNSADYNQAKQNAGQLSKRFSMNKVAKKYQAVYETLLKNKRQP
jgi:glycosyltransferase involved in cell wall biosynthesis